MKFTLIRLLVFLKGLLLILRPHYILGWLKHPLFTTTNILSLSRWINDQDKTDILNDFYSARRDYNKRYSLYQFIVDKYNLQNETINYLEFGVCNGNSFKWWLNKCTNVDSRFYGFDTFEGLPEKWGTYNQGDMNANVPSIEDSRHKFIKGLFQNTFQDFLSKHNLKDAKRKIIHLDADLFSSTLFVLTSLAPYLNKNDLIIFDEFNVPNHEFFAFKIFSDSYYLKTKLVGCVNNYYQVALIVE